MNNIAKSILLFLTMAISCQVSNRYNDINFGVALDSLLINSMIQDQFGGFSPSFHIEKRNFNFTGPNGVYTETLYVIMDRDRYVALYKSGEKPFLDVFAHNPYEAPDTLIMPVRYHNATLLGTRLTTTNWYDKWAISGDEHSYSFSNGGDSLTLSETQRWHKTGVYNRDGYSAHTFTFKCDPKLGYVVDMEFALETDDSTNTNPEFINLMPRDVVNPWPGKNRYHYTIYTPTSKKGYFGYANNLHAGNISDEKKTDWGKGFEVRSGGFIGMLEQNAYSPVLFRNGDHRFVHRTCDAWLDQHNHILLPPKGPDGYHRINAKFLFCYLPPSASNYVLETSKIDDFEGKRATMIRLGITESYEDQPLPMTSTSIGLTKGFWQPDFEITDKIAYSGQKSMIIEGISKEEAQKPQTNFIRYPQVILKPDTKYSIKAMVKVEGRNTEAFITGALYEWTPYDTTRIKRFQTDKSDSKEWADVQMTFTTPAYDPFIDVRFMVIGTGKAYFDDFEFVELK
jgi:hypothetical protein